MSGGGGLNASELYKAGKLDEAIDTLGARLRGNPDDEAARVFLFGLLCFAGELDRAVSQLDVIARGGKDAEIGSWLYRGALHASKTRRQMFESREFPRTADAPPVSGTLNGSAFSTLTDADPRIGASLELMVGGEYLWLPLVHTADVQIEPPSQLRDLVWTPARVRPTEDFRDLELGTVLMPALAPLTWRHEDPEVRLGWRNVWEDDHGVRVPLGQKMLSVDGELVPLLEVRELRVDGPAPEAI